MQSHQRLALIYHSPERISIGSSYRCWIFFVLCLFVQFLKRIVRVKICRIEPENGLFFPGFRLSKKNMAITMGHWICRGRRALRSCSSCLWTCSSLILTRDSAMVLPRTSMTRFKHRLEHPRPLLRRHHLRHLR